MKKPARRKPKRKAAAPVVRPAPIVRARRSHTVAVSAVAIQRWFADDNDRSALIMLMMPVLLLAFSVSAMQVGRRAALTSEAVFERLALERASPDRAVPQSAELPAPPRVIAAEPVPAAIETNPSVAHLPDVAIPEPAQEQEIIAALPDADAIPAGLEPNERVATIEPLLDTSEIDLDLLPPHAATAEIEIGDPIVAPPSATELAMLAPVQEPLAGEASVAAPLAGAATEFAVGAEEYQELAWPPATVEIDVAALDPGLLPTPPVDEAREVEPRAPAVCRPGEAMSATLEAGDPTAADFGSRLAAAALAQTNDYVVYTAKYKRIAFPMGDLPPLHGACSDVVVRAYRALGIDLQQLVQAARLGRDPNIDHRRTETLRRLFARFGKSLPVSIFPEEYQAGDIVTYYRPFSRVSRAHIAIVSNILAPSGRPMIVHNRGWGTQLEDALFADRITGHYRFTGVLRSTPSKEAPSANNMTEQLRRKASAVSGEIRAAQKASAQTRIKFEREPGL
ncbi:DUF1287 domain-containing protein [Leptospira interrogans]